MLLAGYKTLEDKVVKLVRCSEQGALEEDDVKVLQDVLRQLHALWSEHAAACMTGSFDFVIGKMDLLLQSVTKAVSAEPGWPSGLECLTTFKMLFDMFKNDDVKQRVTDLVLEQ